MPSGILCRGGLHLGDFSDVALAFVAWAKDLAGGPCDWRATPQEPSSPPLLRNSEPPRSVSGEPAEPPPLRWSKHHRPGPFDVLTLEEAMAVPWIEGDDHVDNGDDGEASG